MTVGQAQLRTWTAVVYAGDRTLAGVLCNGNKDCGWIYRFRANPGKPGSGIVPLSPVLAPGTALGSRPRVALSSAQALSVYCEPRLRGNSRLVHILAKWGDRILVDSPAKTRTWHRGDRCERDCREMTRSIGIVHMLLSNTTFEKGGWYTTGSR
jgi:hypothetical protein